MAPQVCTCMWTSPSGGRLWVADKRGAADHYADADAGAACGMILNCTPQTASPEPRRPGTQLLRCPLLDKPRPGTDPNVISVHAADAARRLMPILDNVHAVLQNGRDVLVHCSGGRYRSCTAVCAYLMRHQGMSVDAAVDHVRHRHGRSAPVRAGLDALLNLIDQLS